MISFGSVQPPELFRPSFRALDSWRSFISILFVVKLLVTVRGNLVDDDNSAPIGGLKMSFSIWCLSRNVKLPVSPLAADR